MASSQGSGSAAAFLVLAVASVLAASALGKTIPVTWDQSTDYNAWAKTQTFNTGDNLVFTYGPSHTCVQVSEADYNSCNGANQLNNIATGQLVRLASDAYFICTTPGHCQSGMKLAVTLSTPATPTTPAPAGTPAPTTPTTPGTTPTTPGTTPTTPDTPSTPGTPAGSGSAALTAGTLLAASAAIAPFLL